MARRFFGKQIHVRQHEETRRPISVELDGQQHVIQEVMAYWHDYGFPDDGRSHKWIQRRHRNYYRVLTPVGDAFEIYFDRGVSLKSPKYMRWYATKQL